MHVSRRAFGPQGIVIAVGFVVLACLSAGATLARAEGDPGQGFGLGIMIGEPTGVNFKAWTSARNAFVGGAAWSFSHNGSVALHLDYLFHKFEWIEVEEGRLPVYFGVGGRIKLADEGDDLIGARFPIGLNYLMADAPLDFFLEVVPILDLTPDTDFELNAAIGGRFWF